MTAGKLLQRTLCAEQANLPPAQTSTPVIAQESRHCPAALRPIQTSHGARLRGGGLPFRAFNI